MENMPESVCENENTKSVTKKETVEITLKDVVKILLSNKKLFWVSSCIAFFILSFVFLFLLTPVYDVKSSIEIRSFQASQSFSFDAISMLMGGGITNDKNIDLELLKSRTIMDSVIAENNLQVNVKRKNNTMFAYLWNRVFGELPEDAFIIFKKIPDSIKSYKEKGKLIAAEDGYTIEHEGEKAECRWGTDCTFKGGTVAVEKLGNFSIPVSYKFTYDPIIDTRERVSVGLSIQRADDSEMVKLAFTHESPLMAVKVLKDVIDAFIRKKSEWEENDAESKTNYINNMLADLSVGISEKSQKLIAFQQKENTIMPSVEIPELLKKQETLKVQIEEFKFKKQILANTLKSVEKDPGKPITIPLEEDSVQAALKYHNSLLFRRNTLSQRITEEHPVKVAVDEEIKESEAALKNVMKTSISQYEKGEKLLTDLLNMMTAVRVRFLKRFLLLPISSAMSSLLKRFTSLFRRNFMNPPSPRMLVSFRQELLMLRNLMSCVHSRKSVFLR